MTNKVIICLGRQFGSGGKQLGKRLAELLEIDYYDRELMDEMSKQSGLDIEYLERHDEQVPSLFDYTLIGRYGTTRLYGNSQNFVMLSETIKKLADEKSCLIVGRAADYILRDNSNVIKIFIHAPYKYRLHSVASSMGLSVDDADALIQKKDRERSRFYDFFTDKTWGESDTYDLSIDISKLGPEGSAQFLAEYVKQRIASFE